MNVKRLGRITYNYTLGRLSSAPSTANFWYRQAPPRVVDQESLQKYLDQTSLWPEYLFDHRNKLSYPSFNSQGIVVLNYDGIGPQVNPEAAFQFALGLADQILIENASKNTSQFLSICDYFMKEQTPEGDFPYHFDWGANKAPWSSALAQSRGASVLLRAWMASGEDEYLKSALLAISRFEVPIDEGGYLNIFGQELCPYFEEYPQDPSVVINGFMATFFGLYELACWTNESRPKELLAMAKSSLAKMLPHFDAGWWSLYDLHGTEKLPNLCSPFYHEMMINYLRVICTITPDESFNQILDTWQRQNTPVNRLRALVGKTKFKVAVR